MLLYVTVNVPLAIHAGHSSTIPGYFRAFAVFVANMFTGQWGIATLGPYDIPWSTLFADFLPNSIQIALFALPLCALIAYPVSLAVGWSRRSSADAPVRFGTLVVALIPSFVLGTWILYAVFFGFYTTFHDLPGDGIIPSPPWFDQYYGGFPSWVVDGWVTRPTGLPVIDAALHRDWTVETITIVKTAIQASAVALAYLAIFLRHGRSIVASAKQELYVTGSRARGVPERTLLWRHTARRVTPSFLLVFALTIPGYLGAQFVVEGLFSDPGIGFITLSVLSQADYVPFEALVFVLAAFVVVAVLVIDLAAARLDPRGRFAR